MLSESFPFKFSFWSCPGERCSLGGSRHLQHHSNIASLSFGQRGSKSYHKAFSKQKHQARLLIIFSCILFRLFSSQGKDCWLFILVIPFQNKCTRVFKNTKLKQIVSKLIFRQFMEAAKIMKEVCEWEPRGILWNNHIRTSLPCPAPSGSWAQYPAFFTLSCLTALWAWTSRQRCHPHQSHSRCAFAFQAGLFGAITEDRKAGCPLASHSASQAVMWLHHPPGRKSASDLSGIHHLGYCLSPTRFCCVLFHHILCSTWCPSSVHSVLVGGSLLAVAGDLWGWAHTAPPVLSGQRQALRAQSPWSKAEEDAPRR